MTKYRLHYFNARGYAEASRAMFHMAGVEFEDVRYEIDDWIKEENTLKNEMPFGQMPVLEVDGEKIPQSVAIARFVANQLGFAGQTPVEKAWADAFTDLYKDFLIDMKPWAMIAFGYPGAAGDRDELKKTSLDPAKEKYFKLLSKRLEKSKSGFLLDSGISFPDLFFFETTTSLIELEKGFLGTDFPVVNAYFKRIAEHPKLKPYLETRPYSSK
ncbi:glutathione transferase [Caenorhabditis elegans]|uniref:glutathione transferase n=1 Tax=Caenorhabditis elegans TaxID=6239 RepID=O16198_CAEEL|nr:Glutathione S-Transferase [Caenorhabditis elegans]CCD62478.1 Glutathione S-Transferase [Caenorhabditis elegans]|eukprot:NP_503968.1 Glutathione S-Transferase [Caenorhabditis elegans]